MDFLIEKVVDALLETSGLKEKLGRGEQTIRLLQRFGLDDLESLQKFEDVYAYAVVEYGFDEEGQCRPKVLIEFFKRKEVRDLFQAEFNQNSPRGWLQKGEQIAAKHLTGLPDLKPEQELKIFAALFIGVLKKTRSPKEVRQEQKLDSMQRQVQGVYAGLKESSS